MKPHVGLADLELQSASQGNIKTSTRQGKGKRRDALLRSEKLTSLRAFPKAGRGLVYPICVGEAILLLQLPTFLQSRAPVTPACARTLRAAPLRFKGATKLSSCLSQV